MVVSLATFVSVADDSDFTPGDPVTLPNLSKDTVPNEGFEAWSGDVSFKEASKAVTFVFRVTGVETPIIATKVEPTLVLEDGSEWTWSKSSDLWQWNHIWGGIFAPEMTISKDGVYYLYLNQKVLTNNNSIAIKGVKALNIFSKRGSILKDAAANDNDGATFQMLEIVQNDLKAEVEFYDGDRLLAVQSVAYTSLGNATAGDSTTGIEDGVNNKNAKRLGALVTPDELFSRQGETPLPDKTKVVDGKLYRRVWKDEEGNIVDGIYKSGKLTLDYVEADNTLVDVTFVGADGKEIYTKTLSKDALVFTGTEPSKDADADYTYTFAGWSVDGENVISLSSYEVGENVMEITFRPVFKKDLILKAFLSGPDSFAMGGSGTYKIKLNRTDITTDVLSGTTAPITSGKILISYPAAALKAENQIIDGSTAKAVVRFSSVGEDGEVGEIQLNAAEGFSGGVTLSLSGTALKSLAETAQKVSVTGQQPGLYISNPTTVEIARADGNTAPPKQTLWEGSVPLDGANAISFIYKTEGVETPINAYQLSLGYNNDDTSYGWQKIWNETDAWGGALSPRYHTFNGNGYYVLYINSRLVDGVPFDNVEKLSIFSTCTTHPGNDGKDTPENKNENATFTMLAVVGEALAPTVTFHDAQGNVIGEPYTYSYVNEDSFHYSDGLPDKGEETKQTVKLLTPAEIFAKAAVYDEPQKAADECYEYTFAGWVDGQGNPVEAVYTNTDFYPIYEKTAVDPVKVHFTNGDTVLSDADFPGAGHISYSGMIPTKADEANCSYKFCGWTTDRQKTLALSEAQVKEYIIDLDGKTSREIMPEGGELTLYAVFLQTARMWDVRFLAENGTEMGVLRVLGGQLTDPNGGEAIIPQIPVKEADARYTYTPNGWKDADGKQIISMDGKLTAAVTCDIEVYPLYELKTNRYTVTFIGEDRRTELGSSTVDYGTSAKEPNKTPSKEATRFYRYKFTGWVNAEGEAADLSCVTGDITVYPEFTAEFINPFVDVRETDYFRKAVEYAAVNSVMSGTDESHFSPDSIATRGQMVTVLWRMENRPSAEGMKNPFTDLGSETVYYYDAVLWAYSKGLVSGITATEFGPNEQITREQFVTILYRYAKNVKGYYVGYGKSSYQRYPDKDDVHSYAADAFRWAIATAADLQTASVETSLRYNKEAYIMGVAASDGKSYLAPSGKATRGQLVTMLYRFLKSEHVDAPPVKVSGMMTADPSVYAVGDEYQICVAVERECTMWVQIGDRSYYDHSNGILRSDKYLHIAKVPQAVLDDAEGYTVYLREIIERKPYYTECGGLESVEYTFRPLREKEEYNIINLADAHSLVEAPIASGSYFGNELDLLIMNGDIIDNSGSINAFKNIYRVSGGITKGQVPCIYSRGNHELRGIAAEHLAEYTPTDSGKSYYTFRLGPVWGIVLDAGEDKADDNAEYGNTVACSAFRDEEGEFLDEVLASKEWEDASVRLVISHVPLAIKMSAPYNSEQERYTEWSHKLAAIEPTLWLTGHLHQCFLEAPGDRANSLGYPCPVVTSSYMNKANNQHTSGAIILDGDKITARYVTEMGEVVGEQSVARRR